MGYSIGYSVGKTMHRVVRGVVQGGGVGVFSARMLERTEG